MEDIRTGLPTEGRISLAADTGTSPNQLAFLAIVAYWISESWQMEEVLIGFEEIKGSHTGVNMAGIINEVRVRYGIQHRILGFTTDSASNNRTLTEALNNAWSLLAVEWSQLENHIACMAPVVQLILAAFMSSIKVKSRDGYMPPRFKADYIEKVMRLDNGFHKTVEKILCPRSHIIEHMFTYPNIYPDADAEMQRLKYIRPNAYAQRHTHKDIFTDSDFQIERSFSQWC